MGVIPDPLILFLGYEISTNPPRRRNAPSNDDDNPKLMMKFAPNPAAIVDGVELEVNETRLPSPSWRSKLVSVASPAYAAFEVPDWMEADEYLAHVTVTINTREWSSDAVTINIPELNIARKRPAYVLQL